MTREELVSFCQLAHENHGAWAHPICVKVDGATMSRIWAIAGCARFMGIQFYKR